MKRRELRNDCRCDEIVIPSEARDLLFVRVETAAYLPGREKAYPSLRALVMTIFS